MAEGDQSPGALNEKARRREARAIVGAYHQEQLRALSEHVRDGFARLDAGEIDEFELDDLIHRYKRAARKLWSFCGSSGGQWLQAASALEYMRVRGEEHDLVGRERPPSRPDVSPAPSLTRVPQLMGT